MNDLETLKQLAEDILHDAVWEIQHGGVDDFMLTPEVIGAAKRILQDEATKQDLEILRAELES